MAATIITTEDLYEFKVGLLEDIEKLLEGKYGKKPKKWIKSKEVRKILGISPGTIQNLRINGTLPYSKIGGIIYYDKEEILKVLDENTIKRKKSKSKRV